MSWTLQLNKLKTSIIYVCVYMCVYEGDPLRLSETYTDYVYSINSYHI